MVLFRSKKRLKNSTLFKRGTISEQKKAENSTPLKKGTILVPLAALFFLNNHVYETVPFCQWGTKIVPLRVPYYGQSNSAPRGTVSVPFFSECSFNIMSTSMSKSSLFGMDSKSLTHEYVLYSEKCDGIKYGTLN